MLLGILQIQNALVEQYLVVTNLGVAQTGFEGGALGTPVDPPQSGLDF